MDTVAKMRARKVRLEITASGLNRLEVIKKAVKDFSDKGYVYYPYTDDELLQEFDYAAADTDAKLRNHVRLNAIAEPGEF